MGLTRKVQHVSITPQSLCLRPLAILSLILSRFEIPISHDEAEYILDHLAEVGNSDAVALFLQHFGPADCDREVNLRIPTVIGGVFSPIIDREPNINPLLTAVRCGNISIAQALIDWCPVHIHKWTKGQSSVIDQAVSGNYPDILAMLLATGIDPTLFPRIRNPSNSAYECNSLAVYAAEMGYVDILRQLLAHGFHVNTSAERTSTPLLSLAALNGQADMVRFLLDNKAAINAVDKMKRIALSYAAMRDAIGTRLLLEAGAAVDVVDVKGKTPITPHAHKQYHLHAIAS